jgi:hypothetical protein
VPIDAIGGAPVARRSRTSSRTTTATVTLNNVSSKRSTRRARVGFAEAMSLRVCLLVPGGPG